MRKLAAVLCLAVAAVVLADEYNANGTVVQGTGIQTASSLTPEAIYAVQCPNIDGGSGQKVFYRPGGCTGCVVDAGQGDTLVDFTSNQDAYPVRLRARMTTINLRGFNASDTIWCTVAPKSDPLP